MVKIITLVIAVAAYLIPLVVSQPQEARKDAEAIMKNCKTKFPISNEAEKFVQSTGSLKDESDETAMCYLNCIMEGMGIVKGGVFQVNEQLKITERVLKGVKRPDGTTYDVNAVKLGIENCSKLVGKSVCHTNYIILRCIDKKRNEAGIVKP